MDADFYNAIRTHILGDTFEQRLSSTFRRLLFMYPKRYNAKRRLQLALGYAYKKHPESDSEFHHLTELIRDSKLWEMMGTTYEPNYVAFIFNKIEDYESLIDRYRILFICVMLGGKFRKDMATPSFTSLVTMSTRDIVDYHFDFYTNEENKKKCIGS